MTTTFITLDVWQPSNIRVKVNQGEVNSRFLQVKILDKKEPFNLTVRGRTGRVAHKSQAYKCAVWPADQVDS